jgi:shikimate dehydrogenase
MPLYGLIGYPLSHSFSKKYFTEKFEKEGLVDCRYELFSIPSIKDISSILSYPDLVGLNVTIPYKKEVLQYLDSSEHLPDGLNACNCISIRDGKLFGFNTDVIGFEKSFARQLKPHDKNALVLGSGGAALAVRHVLNKLTIGCTVVSRRWGNGAIAYADIDAGIMSQHSIIINTTPIGTYPNTDEAPAIPYDLVSSAHYFFDVVYNPVKSLFLARGEEKGARIMNGYEMLEVQADESWKIWNS